MFFDLGEGAFSVCWKGLRKTKKFLDEITYYCIVEIQTQPFAIVVPKYYCLIQLDWFFHDVLSYLR
jgi:hypothetical protein